MSFSTMGAQTCRATDEYDDFTSLMLYLRSDRICIKHPYLPRVSSLAELPWDTCLL